MIIVLCNPKDENIFDFIWVAQIDLTDDNEVLRKWYTPV